MREEPDNQSSGKTSAKLARKTTAVASTSTFRRAKNTPMIVTLNQHIIFLIFFRTGSRPDSPMSVQPLPWGTVTLCCRPALCLTSRTFLVSSRCLQGPAEKTSQTAISHQAEFKFNRCSNHGIECTCEPLLDIDCVERQGFSLVWPGICVYLPQPPESSNSTSICQHCFGKELTELADGELGT